MPGPTRSDPMPRPISLEIPRLGPVSALVDESPGARAGLVLAHGAGAGMAHAFMAALAQALAERHWHVLRFQFPNRERGSRRPDAPADAHATVRAAVAAAHGLFPQLPLFAGGKSFGARMTTQAHALEPLPVAGLVAVGFPLHPADRPGVQRAEHLAAIRVPMLFVQGTRDKLADAALMRAQVQALGRHATLHVVDDADHAFHVPRRSGRTDAEVLAGIGEAITAWGRGILAG